MRNKVIVPALGWISSGLISIIVWAIKNSSKACSCAGSIGLLYVGILVIIVGLALLASRRQIERMIEEKSTQKQTAS